MNFVWLNRTWPLRPVSCSRVQRSRIPSVSSEPTAIVTSSSVSNRISSSTVKLYSADKLLLRRFARRALEGYSDTDIRDMEAEDAQGGCTERYRSRSVCTRRRRCGPGRRQP